MKKTSVTQAIQDNKEKFFALSVPLLFFFHEDAEYKKFLIDKEIEAKKKKVLSKLLGEHHRFEEDLIRSLEEKKRKEEISDEEESCLFLLLLQKSQNFDSIVSHFKTTKISVCENTI